MDAGILRSTAAVHRDTLNSAVWNDHMMKYVCKCGVDCQVLGTKGISAERVINGQNVTGQALQTYR